jgi:hypothetical protein
MTSLLRIMSALNVSRIALLTISSYNFFDQDHHFSTIAADLVRRPSVRESRDVGRSAPLTSILDQQE